MFGNIAKFRCATTFFSQKMLCLWLAAKFGLAFLLHCCGSQDATGPPGWAVVIYCSRPCFFLGLCFGMCWDSAWKQFEHRVFENCLLRFLGPSIRAEIVQAAGGTDCWWPAVQTGSRCLPAFTPLSRCVFLLACIRVLSLLLWVSGDGGSWKNIDY